MSEENIPDRIKGIPIGIEVKHSPDVIYSIFDEDSEKYVQQHHTYIKAIDSDIKIIEFGT